MRTTALKQHGFTLIEIIISIIAFSILMALIINAFGPQLRQGSDPLYSVRATELGQSYLEEMLGKRYDEKSPLGNTLRCRENIPPNPVTPCSAILGPDVGEGSNHLNFNDFDDYNGLCEGFNCAAPFSKIIVDQSGNPRPDYTNFTVQVSVAYAGTQLGLNNQDTKLATVTVIDPRGGNYIFSVYKTNF